MNHIKQTKNLRTILCIGLKFKHLNNLCKKHFHRFLFNVYFLPFPLHHRTETIANLHFATVAISGLSYPPFSELLFSFFCFSSLLHSTTKSAGRERSSATSSLPLGFADSARGARFAWRALRSCSTTGDLACSAPRRRRRRQQRGLIRG